MGAKKFLGDRGLADGAWHHRAKTHRQPFWTEEYRAVSNAFPYSIQRNMLKELGLNSRRNSQQPFWREEYGGLSDKHFIRVCQRKGLKSRSQYQKHQHNYFKQLELIVHHI
ncbi:hypothetical protein OS493_034873 [Desmophyllum pertusum]|uniref:Uncharacterized protein n=1 Tax=Desmophyllum pertusum TaxID=174260 RepID=A0A9W9ZW17_9CNID|nr:hypothetical protein OS493_034873 [Desmophyllum pertusum]